MAMTVSPHTLRVMGATDALDAGLSVVGGKAFGLARLTALGMRVPRWLVLPTTIFHDHLLATGIDVVVKELVTSLEGARSNRELARVAGDLRRAVMSAEIDGELRRSMETIYAELGPGPLAVRSSAIDEDGSRHSFAGQLDTVLGVDGPDALVNAVQRCWSSAFGERVLDYRRRTGSLDRAADIAVIVQCLVPGEVSGVMFTVDPLTGAGDRMRVSACAGLGDTLVAGEIDGDEYLLDREGRVVEMSTRSAHGAPLLDAHTLAELARAGIAIESAEGSPRDIEWTIASGEIWLLQARPITSFDGVRSESTIPTSWPPVVWDNSNIQESYCGVTTPLTFTFAQSAYASVYEQTMRAVGVPERIIAAHRSMLRNLLGLIHGRVYYNLNNWYRGLLLLPAFRRNKADMERMMGVDEPVDFVADERLGISARLRRSPRIARTLVRLLARFATLDRDTKRFLADFESAMQSVDRPSLPKRSLGELMEVLETLQRQCLDRWTTPIINDFHVMMTVGRLRRLVERLVSADVDRVMQTLLGGADVTVSAAPALLLLEMADAARRVPAAATALRNLHGQAAVDRAAEVSANFGRAYAELISRFGDRCMGELKLESRPLRDDPVFVVGVLKNYLDGAASDPRALAQRARHEREGVERDLAARMPTAVGRWRLRRALSSARRSIRARESMRLARTRLFGAYRDTYRAIGARLHASGRIEAVDDILYLTVGEIDAYWRGTAVTTDFRPLVRTRRREFSEFESIDAPNRIVTLGAPYETALTTALTQDPITQEPPSPAAPPRGLRGHGASPGIAVGRVRIVTGPSDDLSIAGHILVATRTDPGWAPLFPSAAAIVVERGSVLSHSAVLARELGLPAVVGIPNLLRALRDGELVRVDGTAGTVERLEDLCAS